MADFETIFTKTFDDPIHSFAIGSLFEFASNQLVAGFGDGRVIVYDITKVNLESFIMIFYRKLMLYRMNCKQLWIQRADP